MGTQQREVMATSLSGCLALRWENFLIPTYIHLSEGIIAQMHSSEHMSLNTGEAANISANKTLSPTESQQQMFRTADLQGYAEKWALLMRS